MHTRLKNQSSQFTIHIPVLYLGILVLTSVFSLTEARAQTGIDGIRAADTPLQARMPAATDTTPRERTPDNGGGRQEMARVATEIYDQSLGSLKMTLAVMIAVIGGGMVLVMLYLGHLDQRRRQHHDLLLTNAQNVGQQIHASAQELKTVYLEVREWEQSVSVKLRKRYETHFRKNRQLNKDLDQTRQTLRKLEQTVASLTESLTGIRPSRGGAGDEDAQAARVKGRPVATASAAVLPVASVPPAAQTVQRQRQEIIGKVHRVFERELEKQTDHGAVYLNWGNACLKLANRLNGAEREAMLQMAREKWMLAERSHTGTARRQLSVLNAIAGLEGQSHAWSHMPQAEVAGQGI